MRFTFQPGDRPLDGYTIERGVGQGGFGEVYYAVSDGGKEVALKLVQRNLEVELRGVGHCLNLKHPNLIKIYDVKNSGNGDNWVVLEYMPGDSLSTLIGRHPKGMPVPTVLEWLEEICAGIDYLHSNGVVHRDVKPNNIFYNGEVVKIGDYGLSKFITASRRSGQTQSVGTVHYMAPEIGSGRYGKEVDVYAIGVILFEMLTGRVPFDGETPAEILMKHLTAKPDLNDVPAPFRPVVARMLAKHPAQRYASLPAMLADLEARIADVNAESDAVDFEAHEFDDAHLAEAHYPYDSNGHAPSRHSGRLQTRSEVGRAIRQHPVLTGASVFATLTIFVFPISLVSYFALQVHGEELVGVIAAWSGLAAVCAAAVVGWASLWRATDPELRRSAHETKGRESHVAAIERPSWMRSLVQYPFRWTLCFFLTLIPIGIPVSFVLDEMRFFGRGGPPAFIAWLMGSFVFGVCLYGWLRFWRALFGSKPGRGIQDSDGKHLGRLRRVLRTMPERPILWCVCTFFTLAVLSFPAAVILDESRIVRRFEGGLAVCVSMSALISLVAGAWLSLLHKVKYANTQQSLKESIIRAIRGEHTQEMRRRSARERMRTAVARHPIVASALAVTAIFFMHFVAAVILANAFRIHDGGVFIVLWAPSFLLFCGFSCMTILRQRRRKITSW